MNRRSVQGLESGEKKSVRAGVAQSVEQLICNQQVGGSSPSTSSNSKKRVNRDVQGV